MNVLVVEPGKAPYEKDIPRGLESLQKEVGGYIETLCPYADPVAIICNEEGKLNGLPLNRALCDDSGQIYDILAGRFLIVGIGATNFTDLPEDLMEKYKGKFFHPEEFLRVNGKITVVELPIPKEPAQHIGRVL